jgi:Cu+-exporting ATPase
MEIDPVCGIEVDPDDAAGRSEHEGRTFYFCSNDRKAAFDVTPSEYVGTAE